MKRILFLVVCFALIIQSQFTVLSKADATEQTLDAAIKLGLMDSSLKNEPEKAITRGEAISAIIGLYGDTAGAEESIAGVFSDLDKYSPYYDAINTAYSYGIIEGFPDGTIRADETITVKHTVKMLTYILGYKELIANGFDYNKAARSADFCSGGDIASNDSLTATKLAQLLLSAAESNLVDTQGYSAGESSAYADYYLSDETLLSKYFDIYVVEGLLSSIPGADLTMTTPVSENSVRIDNVTYEIGETDADLLIGYNVKAYYRSDNSGSDRTLLYAYPVHNEAIVIDSQDVVEFQNGTLFYSKGDRNEKVDIDLASIDYIYNGELKKFVTAADFQIECGSISIIDNDRDGTNDVLVIEEFKTFVVDTASRLSNVIFGKFGVQAIDFEKYDNIKFISEDGTPMEIAELFEWDVLSVRENSDSIYIIFSLGEVEGTISGITTDEDNKTVVTVNGKEYIVTKACYDNQKKLIQPGYSGIFCLNRYGHISAVSTQDNKQFGYLMNIQPKGSISDVIYAKVLTQNGEIEVFEFAKRLKYDGQSVEKKHVLNVPKNGLILYSCNGDKEINYIDTACDENGIGLGEKESISDSLQMYYNAYNADYTSKETLQYKASTLLLGGKVCIGADMPVFVIPVGESAGDETRYRVYSREDYLVPDDKLTVQAYKSVQDSLTAEAMVIYDSSSASNLLTVPNDTRIMIVSKVRTRIADGEEYLEITAVTRENAIATYVIKDDDILSNLKFNGSSYNIGIGDAIRLVASKQNEVRAIEVIYSLSLDKLYNNNTNPNVAGYLDVFRVKMVYAYEIQDGVCKSTTTVLNENTVITDESQLENLEINNLNRYPIFIFNSEEKTITAATASDICDFKRNSGSCSKMLIYDRFGDPISIFIYD